MNDSQMKHENLIFYLLLLVPCLFTRCPFSFYNFSLHLFLSYSIYFRSLYITFISKNLHIYILLIFNLKDTSVLYLWIVFMMQQPIEDQGLPTDCWPLVHLSVDRGEWSSSQFRDDMSSTHPVPNRCWLMRLGLPLLISSYPNSSWWCIATNHIHWIPLPQGSNQHYIP